MSWILKGAAYGKTYSDTLVLVEKRTITPTAAEIEIGMNLARASGRVPRRETVESYRQFLADPREEAAFKTSEGREIIISPRYHGSKLGSDDAGDGRTICAFTYEGEYVALALYDEIKQELTVREY